MSSPEYPEAELSGIAEPFKIPLVVILGPTAVGKTELAIQLAERFNGEIVSADSRLFYRGMDIGTAKPTSEDRRRVPHHLIDVADPDEIWSLAVFQREANQAIHRIYEENHLPFMVGGTGQFVRAVVEGWSVPAVKPHLHLREVLTHLANNEGPYKLHSKLAMLDPQAAFMIDPTNIRRTIRALEVILSSGKRFSDQKISGHRIYDPLLVGLTRPRAELYQRIDNRIIRMMECGFISEVQRLLDMGYSPDSPTMSAIGYAEIVATIQGKISLEEAIVLMKRRTREFVRRQANWFKENDATIHWFHVTGDTFIHVEKLIGEWLSTRNTAK